MTENVGWSWFDAKVNATFGQFPRAVNLEWSEYQNLKSHPLWDDMTLTAGTIDAPDGMEHVGDCGDVALFVTKRF